MTNRKLPDLEAKALLKTRLSDVLKRYRTSDLSDEALALLFVESIPKEMKEVQSTLLQVINAQSQIISILNDNEDKHRFYQYIQDCIDKNYEPSADIIEHWEEMRDDYFHIES